MKIIQCGHITWTLVVSEQGLQALLLDFLIASLQQEWLALIFFHANKPGQHYLHQVFAAVLNFLIPDASEHFKTKPRYWTPVATVWLGFTWRLGTQQNQRSKDTHRSRIFLPAELLLDKHQYFPSAPTMPEKCTPDVTFSLLNMVCLSQLIPGPFALPDSCLGGGHWLSQSVQPSVRPARGLHGRASGDKFLPAQGD